MEYQATSLSNQTTGPAEAQPPNADATSELGVAALAMAAWIAQVVKDLQILGAAQQQVNLKLDLLQPTLAEAVSRIETVVTETAGARADTGRLAEWLRGIHERQEILERNVNQVRLLNEGLDRKLERLTADYIDCEITEPLFKELLRIFQSLHAASPIPAPHDEILELAASVQRFLEAFGLRVIAPVQGEKFNPKEHQPVQEHLTSMRDDHGLVAVTYHFGLSSPIRIIQPARVALYIYNEITPKS